MLQQTIGLFRGVSGWHILPEAIFLLGSSSSSSSLLKSEHSFVLSVSEQRSWSAKIIYIVRLDQMLGKMFYLLDFLFVLSVVAAAVGWVETDSWDCLID